jgi:hypothetical protein
LSWLSFAPRFATRHPITCRASLRTKFHSTLRSIHAGYMPISLKTASLRIIANFKPNQPQPGIEYEQSAIKGIVNTA